MSKDYHQKSLGGTRETALDTIQKIKTDIDRYGNSGHKDARKHQIIFACNVLSGICRNCETMQQNSHFDIYVDIYTLTLAPKLEANASPVHWKRLLTLLEFLFLMLTRYKLHAEANQLHDHLRKNQLKWEEFDDLKYLLSIHGNQLQLLSMNNNQTATNVTTLIEETFQALEALFVNTKDRLREHSINSNILLREFMNSIITKRPSFQVLLATTLQSVQLGRMYKSFFELLSLFLESDKKIDPEPSFTEHLKALCQFLQMDVHGKLKQQVALQYARVLRDTSNFRRNELIEYCCALLYNLLKLAYVRVRVGNFKDAYTQVCNNMCSFLAHRGVILMHEDWFQYFFVLVFHLLTPMHTATIEIFDMFWQQMEPCLYILHIKLIAELEKLTSFVRKSNLVQFNCCKNPNSWFHYQLKYTQNAFDAYNQLLKKCKDEKELTGEAIKTLKTEITEMLKKSIDTLIKMEHECSKSALAIRKLCITIAMLLQDGNHIAYATDLLHLAKQMTRLKSRISTEDWRMIMRRVNKTASICGDDNLATEILACYIAELICIPPEPDFMTLNSFMQFHHYNTRATSLFKIYTHSTNEFKPLLQKHEKRFFHWLESQYVFKIYDKEKHRELYMITAQRAQTKYDFINAVHAGKLRDDSSILAKVINIHEILKGSSTLSRMEELTLGHTICILLFKRCDELKVSMAITEFQETNFTQLFQEKSLLSLCAMKEIEMIHMAMSAVHAFDRFFKNSDIEPLDSSDGCFLDWARILEDLVSLAVYLQTVGYLDYASETWLLHYRIACTIDDVQSSLRSLAFLCEYNALFENDRRIQLSKEVDDKMKSLIHILENLPQLLRRQQNFTLAYVSQVAYYYACQRKFYESHNLLQLVHHFQKHKLDRQHKYDIVLFTADVVTFRILLKHMTPAKLFSLKGIPEKTSNEDYGLLREIDVITQRMRSFVHVSSADMQPYTLLLFSSLDDFADSTINRLCDNFLGGLFSTALKLCVEKGLALRTAKLLSKWAWINLQMEFLQKAEIKMQMVECILGLRDAKELHASLKEAKSCAIAASKQLQNENEYVILPTGLEEVRKVSVTSTLSLIQEKIYKPSMKLDHKLEKCYNTKSIGKSSQLSNVVLWSRLTLSCLRARFNFLSHDYLSLQVFYENCVKWLQKRRQTIYYKMFQSTVLMCMVHYGHFLRINKHYDKAIDHFKMCIEHCSSLEGKLDKAYYNNFELQLRETKLETYECKTRILPSQKKKPLSFTFKLNEIKTPLVKSSKYAYISKTSCKKPSRNSAFVIFSDRKSPCQAHFTQTKSSTAMKRLTFSLSSTEGSDNSGNESSAEHKRNKNPNIDTCQIIQLSDSDCDVEKEKPKDVYNKNKKMEHTKPKLKFLDSVELLDLSPSSGESVSTTVKAKDIIRKTDRSKNSKDASLGIVNEMQNLFLVSTPKTSKVEQNSSQLIVSQTVEMAQSAVPTIKICGSENSQSRCGVASKLHDPKKRTKRIKTPETATAEDAQALVVPNRMTRMRARQASTFRNEDTPSTSCNVKSLQCR